MARRTAETDSEAGVDWESDGSAGFGPGSDDDDLGEGSFDLTDALAMRGTSSKSKTKGKGKATEEVVEDGEGSGDEAFIRASLAKANFKAGTSTLKSTKAGKAKSGQKAALTGGGSFQSLGLHPSLLRALLIRGFTTPTPIQRAALPHILASPARDVVGMARTGSGKTLAYVVPLIQKLGGRHSVKFGARAVVMVPTRELALQVLKVGKDLAKGFVQGGGGKGKKSVDADDGEGDARAEGLRWGLIVGGDSLEDQFSMIASNPDVLIATPGRLLHLAVEMNLDLRSVQYIVFDEADRLFEMGFATQLHETLHRLPPSRQTLLFSATLPKSLVEFAKAGLQNPKLVRLDSETKISTDLQMAFFNIKPTEKDAALMILLDQVIGVPKGTPEEFASSELSKQKKRKRSEGGASKPKRELASHQTIVFAATKHHVEFLSSLLTSAGHAVSHIYGSLDQSARLSQLGAFRAGRTRVLVVTDLAARGIDIPVLENVVNYDFPTGARAFVHRVGRTARAGRKGWAYSLVTQSELPQLMDLQLFLSRPVVSASTVATPSSEPDYSNTLVLGAFPRERLDGEMEYVNSTLVAHDPSLVAMQTVVRRAQKMYERSQAKASAESFRRAKELVNKEEAMFGNPGVGGAVKAVHPLFAESNAEGTNGTTTTRSKEDLLALVNAFRPTETVFEVGKRGQKSESAQLMRDRRKSLGKVIAKRDEEKKRGLIEARKEAEAEIDDEEGFEDEVGDEGVVSVEAADEAELEDVFDMPRKRKKTGPEGFRDSEHYLGYEQPGAAAERGYSLTDGQAPSFATQASAATLDLGGSDEANYSTAQVSRPSQTRWDRKTKKFVRTDQEGKDNKKLIRTESGAKLPASFRSGAYDEWKARERVRVPKVGEEEVKGRRMADPGGKRYRHKAGPSRPDAGEAGDAQGKGKGKGKGQKPVFGRTAEGKKKFLGPTHQVTRGGSGKAGGKRGSGGVKTVDEMRKERKAKAVRKARSTQPGRKRR